MRTKLNTGESGLTLVEMLTAVSIIVIMGGSSYAVFSTAVRAYHRTQSRLNQSQSCRVAMDQIVTDLSQIQADTSDEMLAIFTEDVPTVSGDRDIISFVTLVKTDPDPLVMQMLPPNASLPLPLSDVRRVAYYIGPKIPIEERQNSNIVPPPYSEGQITKQNISTEPESLALYRIVTTALNPELVVEAFMDSGTIPTVDDQGVTIDFQPDLLVGGIVNFDLKYLVGGIVNFDLKYYDEEGQLYDTWDQTDMIPYAVQILISVIDENRQETTTTQVYAQNPGDLVVGALTQSTLVYLPASTKNE